MDHERSTTHTTMDKAMPSSAKYLTDTQIRIITYWCLQHLTVSPSEVLAALVSKVVYVDKRSRSIPLNEHGVLDFPTWGVQFGLTSEGHVTWTTGTTRHVLSPSYGDFQWLENQK